MKLFLIIGGGDGFDATVVNETELDDAFIALHFGTAQGAPEAERKAYLEHLHDPDNWSHNYELGGVRYRQNYEDGYVEVVQLVGGMSDRLAAFRCIRAIEEERARQVVKLGWNSKHDDEHTDGSLSIAAAHYATLAACQAAGTLTDRDDLTQPPEGWPWDRKDWKPKDVRRNLVRAAALIAAEIERLDRASTKA